MLDPISVMNARIVTVSMMRAVNYKDNPLQCIDSTSHVLLHVNFWRKRTENQRKLVAHKLCAHSHKANILPCVHVKLGRFCDLLWCVIKTELCGSQEVSGESLCGCVGDKIAMIDESN